MKKTTLLFIVSILSCLFISSATPVSGAAVVLPWKTGKFLVITPKINTNPSPAVTISADPATVTADGSSTLTWTGSNADTVTITPDIGSVSAGGTTTVSPSETTVYTITAQGPGGTVSSQVTVYVNGSTAVQPEGSFGEQYGDLVPPDATVAEYDAKRFSLITGVVHDLHDAPLADVRITVHGHPEYGTVRSETDGRFSIPVEGGGNMTLAYQRAGYITSHRQVYVPWNDIAVAETVQMLAEDSAR